MQFLEDNRYNIWQKRKDYKQIKDKMREIKNKYPNVRLFIERGRSISCFFVSCFYSEKLI